MSNVVLSLGKIAICQEKVVFESVLYRERLAIKGSAYLLYSGTSIKRSAKGPGEFVRYIKGSLYRGISPYILL